MKVTRLQRELCADLARNVDVTRSVLKVNGTETPLTYASLMKVIGLPCSGPPIPFRKDLTTAEFDNTCRRFNLHKSGRLSQYQLWAHLYGIDGDRQFDDEFKAKLLLWTIATLLKPTANVHMHFKDYIPMLNVMDNLSEFNWAKFVIDGLLDAIKVFQVRDARSVGGCLLYLQVNFLHRIGILSHGYLCCHPNLTTTLLLQILYLQCLSSVCLMQQGFPMSASCLPTWTDERVRTATKQLRRQGGLQSPTVASPLNL